ncbi:hypothetical protein [Arcticibacter tournemirensis]
MSKEFEAYRFFVMIYVVVIANFAVLISEESVYYIWFLSSIVLLFMAILKEKTKIFDLIKYPNNFKFTRECVYLIVFVVTYPRHYESYKDLNYIFVGALQFTNVLLFFIVYCVNRKESKDNKDISDR